MTDYLLPCPFCGSENLRSADIWLATDEGEEMVMAIQCLDCDAEARYEYWNIRAE